jgi:hypothetical protein
MGRPRKTETGLAEAAEYLYSIADVFKPADDEAGKLVRESRTLLDVSVACLFDAHRRNALVKLRA